MLAILKMGGYGIYVWPAYAVTFGVFAFNLFISFREKKSIQKYLQSDQPL